MKIIVLQFYQDTLETDGATKEEEKSSDSADAKEIKEEDPESPSTDKILRVKTEVDGEEQNEDGNSRDSTKTDMADEAESPPQSESGKPKGVLVLHASQKRRPKKCVQWRAEEELEMHHYFELDETERGECLPSRFNRSSLSIIELLFIQSTSTNYFLVK